MIRYLFLIAAIFGLIAVLTARHINWWWVAEKAARVLIALSYMPPHRFH